ncbi:MAG: hypothetical protein ABIQ32_10640 [Sphingomicrobium sp.]
MTNSTSSFMALIFGLAVFAIIVAVGWRSVQNRRILRLQGADGRETIIVAGEDDEISSVVTTSETVQAAPEPSVVVVNNAVADPRPEPESSGETAATQSETDEAGRDRLSRVVSSNT